MSDKAGEHWEPQPRVERAQLSVDIYTGKSLIQDGWTEGPVDAGSLMGLKIQRANETHSLKQDAPLKKGSPKLQMEQRTKVTAATHCLVPEAPC